MAACGSSSTVAVTVDGELLVCGLGEKGELGLGAVLHQQQPARAGGLELFGNQRIRLAAAGFVHLAVVAEDGAVYTSGCGIFGQLGLGDQQQPAREGQSCLTTSASAWPRPATATWRWWRRTGRSTSAAGFHVPRRPEAAAAADAGAAGGVCGIARRTRWR